jgi:uncharacterized membrane protein
MNIKNFFIIFIILLLIDSIFLFSISKLFQSQIISVQKSPIKYDIIAIILCYFFLSLAFNYFIIDKKSSNILDPIILGLVIYGVYETTCKAILSEWKWATVLIDTIWGSIFFTLVFIIYKKLN